VIEHIKNTNKLVDVMEGCRWHVPIHKHGFVDLIDVMPRLVPEGQTADSAIAAAARVSYAEGTKHIRDDESLIRYLFSHRHTSPFEMIEFKFHCCLPIFVARQWIRHRTACLSEGTNVYFDLPGGIARRGNQLYQMKIEEIYRKFHQDDFRNSRIKSMKIRQVDDRDCKIQHSNIINVYKNGVKPVFEITTGDGKKIQCTSDHKFLFSDGWGTLKEKLNLHQVGDMAVWDAEDKFLYVNGEKKKFPALYEDKEWLDNAYNIQKLPIKEISEICGVSYSHIRKWLREFKLTDAERAKFQKGNIPWNTGLTYKFGPRKLSDSTLAAIRKARSGCNSNFWKGGMSSERESIGRWTTQIAHKIHENNRWTCQLCGLKSSKLRAHHVIPVWADLSLSREESNLTTLCNKCHGIIHGKELEYVEFFMHKKVDTSKYIKKKRIAWNKLDYAKLVKISNVAFVGNKETYDIEVSEPHNFIANGFVTHNSVNEISSRFSILSNRFFVPSIEDVRKQSNINKQGGEELVDEKTATEFIEWAERANQTYQEYEKFIEKGIARELARINLPVSVYTEWIWKIDGWNLLHFLSLRMDKHAQKEFRDYANAMFDMVKIIAPVTCKAFMDYKFEAITLSKQEINAISLGTFLESDSSREQKEFDDKIEKLGIYIDKHKETGIPCFECGEKSGIDCPGRKVDEATRCSTCLKKFMEVLDKY